MRLILLKYMYKYRMAKPTHWVSTMLDYKKVKSSISTSHPYPPLGSTLNISMVL